MLGWMNANDLALLVTEWLATLPPDVLAKPPVCISVAETYVKAGQWSRLREWVGKGNWMEADYLRRAFLALALERSKEPEAGAAEWKQAIAAAQSSPVAIAQFELLAKTAIEWRWKERAEELLWKIAAFPNPPKWVLDSLWTIAMQRGDTGHLQMVAGMMARMNFQDLAIRNNYIFLSLLTRTEEGNPHRAAEALHKEYPDNAYVTSTYGLSLYQQGKPEEAVAIMGALKPEDLRQPQLALYHGIFLTAAGQRETAEEFLQLAADWPMLPEEKALLHRVKTAAADATAGQEKKRGTKDAGNPAVPEKN
jgi:predicted Zn-dependent protease